MKLKPYEKYKDSGVEWIGEVPYEWEVVRNKNIFSKSKNIVGGNWKNFSVLSLTKKGVIIRDIDSNEGKMPSDFSVYQIVNPDNLLMCLFDIDVTPRCIGYIENKGIVSAAYSEISPISKIHTKFYYYWYLMLDMGKQLLHLSKNLRNSISNEDFMALNIIRPSYEEQKQIANFLDKKTLAIDKAIEKNKKLIELLEEKRTSLINHVVNKGLNPNAKMKDSGVEWVGEIPEDWRITRVKTLFKVVNGSTPSSDEKNWNGGIIWITPSDLGQLKTSFIYSSDRTITKRGYESCGTHLVPENSIIVSSRAPIGHLGISAEKMCTNQGCKSLIPQISLNINYFYYFMESFKDVLQSKGEGATFMELSSFSLKSMKILNPYLSEQNAIASFLDKKNTEIKVIIKKVESHIHFLEEFKESIIHHLVTGKVNVGN